MKEIEFRGKLDKEDNEWFHGDLIQVGIEEKDYYIIDNNYSQLDSTKGIKLNTCLTPKIDKETLGQYTGLMDKTGIKIFEGDIVKINYRKGFKCGQAVFKEFISEVRFESASFAVSEKISSLTKINPLHIFMRNEIEVIGNVYDNPELLNDKT